MAVEHRCSFQEELFVVFCGSYCWKPLLLFHLAITPSSWAWAWGFPLLPGLGLVAPLMLLRVWSSSFAVLDHYINNHVYTIAVVSLFVRRFWVTYQVRPSFKLIFFGGVIEGCTRQHHHQQQTKTLTLAQILMVLLRNTAQHSALLTFKEDSWQKPSFLMWRKFYLDRRSMLSKVNIWGSLYMCKNMMTSYALSHICTFFDLFLYILFLL